MIKLKIASKKSELHCKNQVTNLEHDYLVSTLRLAILMIKVCWGTWNVSSHAEAFHMTYTVISYEITLEKCINVSVVEVLGEVMVVIDLFNSWIARMRKSEL